MSLSLLVLGGGGHGRVVADAALSCGYERIAFLDDGHPKLDRSGPWAVLGPLAMMDHISKDWPAAIAAIGEGAKRLALFQRLRESGFQIPTIVHPSAVVSRNAHLGACVFVAPGAIINIGAKIGDAAIVNTGARVDHDCDIGAGSHLAPGATLSGGVTVGERVWLGTGCSVRQNVTIGDDAVIGVGAAVVANLNGGRTYFGVPARPSSIISEGL